MMVEFISYSAISVGIRDLFSSYPTIIPLVAFSILLLRIIHKAILYPEFLSPLREIPTPPGRSLIKGHFTTLSFRSPIPLLRHWSSTVPNNGFIRFYQPGNNERLLVTSPEALTEVLVTKATHFVKPEDTRRRLSYLTGNGILFAEGEEHRVQRKGLMPAFSFRHIKDLYPIFWGKARELTKCLENEIGSRQSGGQEGIVQVRRWATRTTLDIIGLASLGYDFGALQNPNNTLALSYRQMLQEPSRWELLAGATLGLISKPASRMVSRLLTKRVKQVKAGSLHIRTRCQEMLSTRKNNSPIVDPTNENKDIITVALNSGVFTDSNLVDQMMTFLAAGHGTTSRSLIWAVYALCKYPEIQTRLRQEIRDHLPSISDPGSNVLATDIDGLAYLHAVCSETLRFYPPVPVTVREALHDTMILGHRIPKGTVLSIAPAVLNHDAALWGPDAGVFDPERWMREGCANSGGVRNHNGFLTFLHGPRSCIGASFARSELACLVAALVGRFQMELEDPDQKDSLLQRGVGSGPADGLRVRLKVVDGW